MATHTTKPSLTSNRRSSFTSRPLAPRCCPETRPFWKLSSRKQPSRFNAQLSRRCSKSESDGGVVYARVRGSARRESHLHAAAEIERRLGLLDHAKPHGNQGFYFAHCSYRSEEHTSALQS